MTPVDEASRHRKSQLVAIDALPFVNWKSQFKKTNIDRELNKAYIGFHSTRWDTSKTNLAYVETCQAR